MKSLMIVLGLMMLGGCSFIIGRHPDNLHERAYCYPCIDSTGNFGIGIRYIPPRVGIRKFAIGWTYE